MLQLLIELKSAVKSGCMMRNQKGSNEQGPNPVVTAFFCCYVKSKCMDMNKFFKTFFKKVVDLRWISLYRVLANKKQNLIKNGGINHGIIFTL